MSSGCRHPAYLFRPRNTTQTPIFSGWSFLVSHLLSCSRLVSSGPDESCIYKRQWENVPFREPTRGGKEPRANQICFCGACGFRTDCFRHAFASAHGVSLEPGWKVEIAKRVKADIPAGNKDPLKKTPTSDRRFDCWPEGVLRVMPEGNCRVEVIPQSNTNLTGISGGIGRAI